jgi:membrane protein DedA with SNARE-associated domain
MRIRPEKLAGGSIMLMELVVNYLLQYGYIFLFISFILLQLALPLPGEVIMGYVGFLVFQGKMDWFMSIFVIGLGLCTGITISYYLGDKFGHPFLYKYGRYIHMGPKQLDGLAQWFGKYGNKVLIAGFFVPGLRHFTGYFAGIIGIPFRIFLIYAYIGAFLFASTFISLGRFLGSDWEKYHALIANYISIAAIIVILILLIIYIFRYKGHIQDFIANLLEHTAERYHCSLLRVKLLASSILIVFSGLIILMIGIIQEYLAKDFGQFDLTVTFLINLMIKNNFVLLKFADYLTSINLIGIAILFELFWILIKSKERFLDISFLLVVFTGGLALQELLQFTFNRYGVSSTLSLSFPSEQAFLVSVIWGYFIYLFLRYNADIYIWLRTIVTLAFIFIIVLVGLNHIILGLESPSDIVVGYVFGVVWLSFNLILLEIIRLRTGALDTLNPSS